MYSLKRLGRMAATTGAALVLCTAMSTSGAYAATGTFAYDSPESGALTIENPANGECRLLLQGAVRADNHTDTDARLFRDQGCEEPLTVLAPGESRDFREPIPHSVMFG
ncbi:hypothetical protein [Embleya hyalina]|uniref:Uncharacterized protein n=1 Tax=Embleya hyalina TaxID=516124 RepID=A0A401YCV3_9ACTN|nr:hypothetical protein [Embleya hyalina]GCD92423.1 hypothetical protein EHYA_00061 [Embleya hyalina]